MTLDQFSAWAKLKAHQDNIATRHLRDMFTHDEERFNKFSISQAGITLDYSKNRASDTTVRLLMALARQCKLEDKIAAMFNGEKVNSTENRAVLHTALRQQSATPLLLDGVDINEQVRAALAKMAIFTRGVHQGELRSSTNEAYTDIVCLGIGGSFLGPKIVFETLKDYRQEKHKLHFVANVDGWHLSQVLEKLNPKTTLVIVASKSFTTEETMLNANTSRRWLLDSGIQTSDLDKHIVAITSEVEKAIAFGVSADNIFPMWDWVGGRYSLWSAIGLPIALAIGFEQFEQLLKGANAMDEHFHTAPLEENMPVVMALMGIWNINFWGATSYCLIPYCHALRGLPAHIQQLDMESNGKSISIDGKPLDYLTGPAIWGSEGVNSQHAFFQQIHQSNILYPVDFIIPLTLEKSFETHHDVLVSHCIAQSQALMQGKTEQEALAELLASGMDAEQAKALAPHKAMAGNKPNNVLLLDTLSPYTVGALLALYEHKVVAQGMIWGINSFDQWGVELGKQLSKPINQAIGNATTVDGFDCSTNALINLYMKHKANLKHKHSDD